MSSTRYHRLERLAVLIALTGAGLLLAVFLYMALLDRLPPITAIEGRQVGWDPKSRTATIEWKARANRSCVGVANRYLENGIITQLPPIALEKRDGFQNDTVVRHIGADMIQWTTEVHIPTFVMLDHVTYRFVAHYACNVVQQVVPIRIASPGIEIALGKPWRMKDGESPQ